MIASPISLETAIFIGNKYSPLCGLSYMYSIVSVIIIMMSFDDVKTKSKLEKIETKNNLIPVQIKPKYAIKINSRE